jgi:hypothetical protein
VEIATFVATLIGALSTAALGFVAFSLSRHAHHYAVQRAIGDLQTAMARFRADFPEVMRMSAAWDAVANAQLYGRRHGSDNADVVRYYSYIELGLEFCNTTLAAADSGRLSTDVFDSHYRPLVRHFLAENYLFVSFALQGPYLSRYVRKELLAAETDGWDWMEKHHLLAAEEVS